MGTWRNRGPRAAWQGPQIPIEKSQKTNFRKPPRTQKIGHSPVQPVDGAASKDRSAGMSASEAGEDKQKPIEIAE